VFRRAKLGLVLMLAIVAGCFHATVETGLTPGTETIEKPWAASFIYGLVPPSTVNAASTCRSGVARVETKQSFLNGLVHGLTFGIFTPMTIKVTCAASRAEIPSARDLAIRAGSAPATWSAVFASAANAAAVQGSVDVVIVKNDNEQN
jgi:hypothetical protein